MSPLRLFAIFQDSDHVALSRRIGEGGFIDFIQDNRAYPSERKTAPGMKNVPVLGKVVKAVLYILCNPC